MSDPQQPVDPPSTLDDEPVNRDKVNAALRRGSQCVHCGSSNTVRHFQDGSTVDSCVDCGLRTIGFIRDESIDLDIRPSWAWRTPQDHERQMEYDTTGLT